MWNYKTAILSSLVRSAMFFATTASAGLEAATGAMLALATSIAFTGVSTAFNLFAMRRGALIVGAAERPLAHDLRAMPKLLFLFVTTVSRTGRVRA